MRSKFGALLTSVALLFSFGAVTATAPPPVSAAASDTTLNVTYTLEGCNLDHGGTFNNDGTVTCSPETGNQSAYTTGNLGKSWAELDLVPLQFTLDNGSSSTQSGSFVVAGDYKAKAGDAFLGWDAIGAGNGTLAPVLDTTLSSPSCPAVTWGDTVTTPPGAGVGGAYQTIYREVTASIPAGLTCVYNYWMRLALGAHLFNGSSLQANLWNPALTNNNVGQKRVQLPVAELLPPEISKDMSASQPVDYTWNLTKTPNPASLDFGNVCSTGNPTSLGLTVTVNWTKSAAIPGVITIITHVYAVNNAHRDLTVNATDVVYSGTTPLYTVEGSVNVPANTADVLVINDERTVPAGTTDLNDSATATVTDTFTGLDVPGTLGPVTATASVQAGATTNGTATITDSESIIGSGLTFSVATPSVGTFTGGYVAGTPTTSSVGWSSGTQSATGSVTFHKTVYAPAETTVSGTLSDTANLTGSDGFNAVPAQASISITSHAAGTLTINKDIQAVSTDQTFSFTVKDAGDNEQTVSITIPAGATTGHVDVSNLPLGSTTVTELTPPAGWTIADPQTFNLGCSGSITMTDSFVPATAEAVKVTVPSGNEAGWDMTLTGPGAESGETVTTGTDGHAVFTTPLEEGSYTITEASQSGWVQDTAVGECSFTVSYPTDAGHNYVCTFTNVEPDARIVLSPLTATNSVTDPHTITATVSQNDQLGITDPLGDAVAGFGPAPDGTLVTFSLLNNTAGAAFVGGVNTCTTTGGTCSVDINSSTPGSVDIHATTTFSVLGVSLTRASGDGLSGDSADANKVYVAGTLIIRKVTNPADGTGFGFTTTGGLSPATFSLDDGEHQTYSNLPLGSYGVTESLKDGWDFTSLHCTATGTGTSYNTNGRTLTATLAANGVVDCTYTNTERGNIDLVKTVSGGPIPAGDSFTFQIRTGASTSSDGTVQSTTVIDSTTVMPAHLLTNVAPGAYQICELAPGPGWILGVADMAGAFQPNGGVSGYFCAPITLAAGQTLTITLDNAPPPGGVALTIGYWKTHSCQAPGHQADVLGETLALFPVAAGQTLPGFYVGDLYVDTCDEAVSLLSKTPINATKNAASDPAFNFAAQYVAYELNLMAGAADNPAAASAAADGQSILEDIGFDGTKSHSNLTKAQKADLLSDANTLDLYNNNSL